MIIKIAKIGSPHGLDGKLKINWLNQNYNLYKTLDRFYIKKVYDLHWQTINVHICWISNLISLQDVKSREQASLFTNGFLGIERNLLPELPKDEFYICDLLGLEVYNQEDQRLLGIIYDVIENKAHPILHLKNSKEKDIFIPFITKFVISLENNKLWVDWYSDESEIMNKQ